MNTNTQQVKRRQRGMSIVEVMVAMTISVILLAGVVEIFASSKLTYRVQDNLSRLQENGRFALTLLNRELRMAGYTGCTSFGPVTNTLKNPTSVLYNFEIGIEGFDNVAATTPTYLSSVGIDPKDGSDVIVVRRLTDDPVRVSKNNNGAQVFTEVSGIITSGCADGTDKVSNICEGDILMVSDCQKSRIFQAGNLTTAAGDTELNITHPSSGTPGNDPASWGGASLPPEAQFGPDAELVKIGLFAYYIKDLGDGTSALYVYDGNQHLELAGGIQDMQVRYGVDTDEDRRVDNYRDAGAVTDWEQVLSAQVHLLLVTQDNNMAPSPQGYTFFGTTTPATSLPADDKHLRREFATTVALRNRAS
jgi:type IV pilus assembly protein PilW